MQRSANWLLLNNRISDIRVCSFRRSQWHLLYAKQLSRIRNEKRWSVVSRFMFYGWTRQGRLVCSRMRVIKKKQQKEREREQIRDCICGPLQHKKYHTGGERRGWEFSTPWHWQCSTDTFVVFVGFGCQMPCVVACRRDPNNLTRNKTMERIGWFLEMFGWVW